jgi:energy-coupling factor transport system ATP-binding protein
VPGLSDTVVAAKNVGVSFPGALADAVSEVSFSLSAGEAMAVFGPSGSGKSTLALALLGAIPAFVPANRRGEIRVFGKLLADGAITADAAVAAAVLQDTDAQIVALTVEDEIAFALENRGAPAAVIDASIDWVLGRPPGAGLLRRDRTLTLSGGWRQRLSLAAALAEHPQLLVVDEPVSHLDGFAADETIAALASVRGIGCASIVVEHRADRILADRALVLGRDGIPVALSTPAQALRIAADQPDGLGLRLPAAITAAAALRKAGLLSAAVEINGARDLVDTLGDRLLNPAVRSIVIAALGLERLTGSASRTGPPLLVIEHAVVVRGGRTILRGVDLQVTEGEIVGLTGPNGAGKTTLAFLAAGGVRAKAGSVWRAPGVSPCYVPQNPSLAFASGSLEAEATRRRLAWRDVAAQLERSGLPAHPHRHPLAFSHGERRKLSLVFTLALPGRRLILLDEPGSGLDGLGLQSLRRDIEALRCRGCGVVVITHDLDLLAGVCDRIAVIDQGVIVAQERSPVIASQVLSGKLPLRPTEGLQLAARLGWRASCASAA